MVSGIYAKKPRHFESKKTPSFNIFSSSTQALSYVYIYLWGDIGLVMWLLYKKNAFCKAFFYFIPCDFAIWTSLEYSCKAEASHAAILFLNTSTWFL